MTDHAIGLPTRNFFVNMLTRDIETDDSILDLLDNCLDGILRVNNERAHACGLPPTENLPLAETSYEGFEIDVAFDENELRIKDNCGGIPRERAVNYAFRMGHEPNDRSDDAGMPTVGIYGIGMKRAIFKIGRSAEVYSLCDDDSYMVEIPDNWIDASDDEWGFPLHDSPSDSPLQEAGTCIVIHTNDTTRAQWASTKARQTFENGLVDAIRQTYGVVLGKGLKVVVNGRVITGEDESILMSPTNLGEKGAVNPFVFEGEIAGLRAHVIVGLRPPGEGQRSPILTEDEIDDANAGRSANRTAKESGCSIICNDRVVVYHDKTHVTGWGEGGVPRFHNQFIGIVGYAFLESDDPSLLPMTTTKRGVDLSSAAYSTVKSLLQRGLKLFTDYTNRWKGTKPEGDGGGLEPMRVRGLFEDGSKTAEQVRVKMDEGSRRGPRVRDAKGDYLVPDLPAPKRESSMRRIAFSRPLDEIRKVADACFEDGFFEGEPRPSDVGAACFDHFLRCAGTGEGPLVGLDEERA